MIGLVLSAKSVTKSDLYKSIDLRVIIYLRDDLWNALRFSDKAKITYGNGTTSLGWSRESLLEIISLRLKKHSRNKLSLETLMTKEQMTGKQSKFDYILSKTFMRPRDTIQFINCCIETCKNIKTNENFPKVITNKDIRDSRIKYSGYLRHELDDEITPHWPEWRDSLHTFSKISKTTFEYEDFIKTYNQTKSNPNKISAQMALSLLFEYSVIGYETRSGYGGSGWCFKYLEPEAEFDAHAKKFKVHDGLKEVANLKQNRTAGQEENPEENDE